MTRWARRAITIPLYFIATLVIIPGLPIGLSISLLADLAQRKKLARTRFILFAALYFVCESMGILASFLVWVVSGGPFAARSTHWVKRNYTLQRYWSGALFHGVCFLYKLDFTVSGDACLSDSDTPIILFMRHASIADTVLPSHFLTAQHGYILRYVMKSELLWDPCLDIVGHRLPDFFVHRKAGDSKQIQGIVNLLDGLGHRQGIFIYPEGTRFSRQKQKDILEKIKTRQPEVYEKVKGLKNILPRRFGGAIGLLQRNVSADVVFCVHTGFESANHFVEFVNGSLINQKIHISFQRIRFKDIPTERDDQIDWLIHNWIQMDAWLESKAKNAGVQRVEQ